MGTKSKYFILDNAIGNYLDFDLDYGTSLSLVGESISFIGSSTVDSIFVRPGVPIDFTLSGSGADKVYLSGNFASYKLSLAGSVMNLQKGSGNSLESVNFIKATTLSTSDSIIFSDGAISSFDLYNYVKNGYSLPSLQTTETSSNRLGSASPGAVLGASMKAFALDPDGDTFASVNAGNSLIVVGSASVDSVYVKEGAQVDATLLGGGKDLIYFTGSWSDYQKTITGSVINFTRLVNGNSESVKVVAANSPSLNDQLVFADGGVGSYSAKAALVSNSQALISSISDFNQNLTTPGISPKLSTSQLNGVTNLSVDSNIALNYSEAVNAANGKYIHIVNDANTTSANGFHGESTAKTLDILVTDTSQVTFSADRKTVILNPLLDLDLANAYHISIDDGAFYSVKTGKFSSAFDGTSALQFSTVTPGTGMPASGSAPTTAVASQAMDASGGLVASKYWLDIENLGSSQSVLTSVKSATTLDLSNNNYALVFNDYKNTAGPVDSGNSPLNDGITTGNFWLSVSNFSTGDVIYIDNQGAPNYLTLVGSFNPDLTGTAAFNRFQFALNPDPALSNQYGGFLDLTLPSTAKSATFDTIAELNLNLGQPSVLTNTHLDLISPTFVRADSSADGTKVILSYNEKLSQTTAQSGSFSVFVNNQSRAVTSIAVVNETIQLTLASPVVVGQDVKVSYTDPTSANDAIAVQDLAGNDAITLALTSVTVTDVTPPAFVSATTSSDGTKVTLTYSEPLHATTAAASQFVVQVAENSVTVSTVAVNGSTVQLSLASPITFGQAVTVAYTDPTSANDSNAVQDLSGNDAASLTATSVTNAVVDTTPPSFVSASTSADGTKVILTYSETLHATTAASSQFAVVVAGSARTVSSVAVSGSTVELTLSTLVTYGQSVTVAYADPSSGNDAYAVQDLAGNDALSLTTRTVTNAVVDATAPSFVSASTSSDGTQITLTYSEALHATTAASSQFAVMVAGSARAVSSVAVSGSTVQLTLSSAITYSQSVSVTYTDPTSGNDANAVQDLAGNDAASLTTTTVTNAVVDSVAPTLQSSTTSTDGSKVTLTFSEALHATTAAAGQFSVNVAGVTQTPTAVAVSGSTVQLSLSTLITYGQSVTVSYSDPTTSNDSAAVQDLAGNDAASITASAVTNAVVDATPPSFVSATTSSDGTQVILTYSEALNSSTAPAAKFAVVVAGTSQTPSSAVVSGSTVQLTLSTPITYGQDVKVTYSDPTTANDSFAVQDLAGNDASTLASTTVTNLTTQSVTYPSIQPKPFILQGNTAVDHWVITTTFSVPAHGSVAASTQTVTQSVMQDSSGGNINFDINPNGFYPGETFNITAVGYNSANTVAAVSGQLGLSSGFFVSAPISTFNSSINFKVISLATDGTISGLPTSFTTGTGYVLTGTTGVGNGVQSTPFSLDTLKTALQNNAVFKQYFDAHYILPVDLAVEAVRPMGYQAQNPLITINGTTVPLMRSNGNWAGMAMEASNAGTVKIWISTDGGVTYSSSNSETLNINSGDSLLNASTQFHSDRLGVNNSINSSSSAASLIKVYFTNSSNAAVAGLKIANLPVDGGILTSSNWITAPSNSSNALNIYNGTVAQILVSKTAAPAGSLFYIKDTIENIQAAGAQLYALEVNNQIIGATPTNGFAPIAMSGSSGNNPITINDGSGHVAHIRASNTGVWTGETQHSVLSVKASSATSVSAFIDAGTLNIAAGTSSTSAYTSGWWTIPSSVLTTLASSSSRSHTLTFTASTSGVNVTVGVVPPGGGWPSSYSSSLPIWVGSAKQLPTSLSDISANTLYIVSDVAANIVNLMGAGNSGSTQSAVVDTLAAQGLLAYSPTYGMGWASLHQLEQSNNIPIANVGGMNIYDNAYTAEHHMYELGAGQSLFVRDGMSHLLNAGFTSMVNTIKSGGTLNNGYKGLEAVFNTQATSPGYSHIQWSGDLATLSNSSNEAAISAVYNGVMKLDAIVIADTVANYNALSDATISTLSTFVSNNYASGSNIIELRDTASNLYSALIMGSSTSTLTAKLAKLAGIMPTATGYVYSAIGVYDTVANLEAEYKNGHIAALENIALLSTTNSAYKNGNLAVRVLDTVANIEALLDDASYSTLVSKISSVAVLDSAANIANDIDNHDGWNSAVGYANNIVVQDSYTNVKSNADTLFGGRWNGEVTKVIFTDITDASAGSPLMVSSAYSNNGQMPVFDFSQAVGFAGKLTVTEKTISNALELTVADSFGKQVKIDLVNYSTADVSGSNKYSIILPPGTSQSELPGINSELTRIKGDSSVSKWLVTVNIYDSNNTWKTSATQTILQDSSGNDTPVPLLFNDIHGAVKLGSYLNFSVQGLSSTGVVLKSGQIIGSGGVAYSSGNLYIAGLDANGNVTYLPSYAGNNFVVLASNLGIDSNYLFSVSSLKTALTTNSVLQQYASNGSLGTVGLEGVVKPAGINKSNGSILVNGYNIDLTGDTIWPGSAIALSSSVSTTVKIWASINNGSFSVVDSRSLTAGHAEDIGHWAFGLVPFTGQSNLNVTKIYFTDANGNSIPTLKGAVLPSATGGLLTDNSWIAATANSPSNAKSIYSGTVSQILAVTDTSGLMFVRDTYSNIQNAGSRLYDLITSGKVIGSKLTDGFDGIPNMSSSELSSLKISDGNGNFAYLHVSESRTDMDATMKHAVISTNGTGTFALQIDGNTVGNLTNISGNTGVVLSSTNLVTYASNSTHTLSISGNAAQLGLVPPGGGLDINYQNSIKFWIGSATELPTSPADILSNTLYIVRDTPENLMKMDGYASLASSVIGILASTGSIAYSSTKNLTYLNIHELQQSNDNFAIANVSDSIISDKAYAVSTAKFWNTSAGQQFSIDDDYAQLMSPVFAKAAKDLSTGVASVAVDLWDKPLIDAFDNHRVQLVDNTTNLFRSDYISSLSSTYYANGSLSKIVLSDSASNYLKIANATLSVSAAFKTLLNTSASNKLVLDLEDTVASINSFLTNSAHSTNESNILNAFTSGGATVYSKIHLHDSVANLEAAFDSGLLNTIKTASTSFISGAQTKLGTIITVEDTISNINTLITSGKYSDLSSSVKNYQIVDTASNIASAINNSHWNEAVNCSDNITVLDTYTNVFNNASTLFGQFTNKATKIVFTDISGASSSNPLIISSNYSNYGNGLMPEFDFTNAGFTGNVSVQETKLTTIPSGYSSAYGSALTISDSNSHSVTIDMLSDNSNFSSTIGMHIPSVKVPVSSYTTVNVAASGSYSGAGGAKMFNIDSSLSSTATISNFGPDDVLNILNRTSAQGINFSNSAWNDGVATLYSGNIAINLTGLTNGDNFNNEATFKSLYGSGSINYAVI
jgi:uncharacterized repeat protein (TIGR02059 family)